MLEDSKYYTPSIDEFFVGFEYEMYNPELQIWESKVIKNSEHLCYFLFNSNNKTWREDCKDVVRVKHLDESDIESLGWIDISNEDSPFDLKSYTYKTYILIRDNLTNIKIFKMDLNKDFRGELFQGTIKNISELRKLLKQIGISDTLTKLN